MRNFLKTSLAAGSPRTGASSLGPSANWLDGLRGDLPRRKGSCLPTSVGRTGAVATTHASVTPLGRSIGAPETSGKMRDGELSISANAGSAATSADSSYADGSLWGMYGDQTSSANPYGSQAGEAWAAGWRGSSKTVVGIIDSGIDYTHPDLYLNIWINQGELNKLSFFKALNDGDRDGMISFRDLNQSSNSAYVSDHNGNGFIDAGDLLNDLRWENGIDDDANGYLDDLVGWDFSNNDNDPFDDYGHGSHCAGTIGAIGGNGTGVAGVSWNTQLMPLKLLNQYGRASTSGAAQAIDYYSAATTAWDKDFNPASSCDYIGTNNSWGGLNFSDSLLSSIVNGASKGNLFITAAGNNATDIDSSPYYPSSYSTLAALGWEAVVTVAAISSSGDLWSRSNTGATSVDLGAPGTNILSTAPGGGYVTYSGTSMAAPHVAGALALMAASVPAATPQQLLEALYASSASTASLAGKTSTGGRLDVSAAVQRLAGAAQPAAAIDQGQIIWGTNRSDVLTGAKGGGTGADQICGLSDQSLQGRDRGARQIDRVSGGDGADLFLLADSRGNFYNDGNKRSSGKSDYLWISDFNSNEDKLQLSRSSQYLYQNIRLNNATFTEIYISNGDRLFNSQDELIARLEGQTLAPGSGITPLNNSQPWISLI